MKKGEQKTAELQQKLKDAGMEVLQGFSLGGSSVYQWEGEDYRVRAPPPPRPGLGPPWISGRPGLGRPGFVPPIAP